MASSPDDSDLRTPLPSSKSYAVISWKEVVKGDAEKKARSIDPPGVEDSTENAP